MTRTQKLAICLSCIFYVATIFGFFYLDLPIIIALFVLFTLSILLFAYLCYHVQRDYTGADHLQQEIGVLNAEIARLKGENEANINEKNSELYKKQLEIDNLNTKITETEAALEEAKNAVTEQPVAEPVQANDALMESLLPPDDEDPAVTVDIIDVARQAIADLRDQAREAGLIINISSASDKLMVHAGRKRLLIMFRNIIDNSIKYMQTAGSLVITISAIEDDIFIVLKDTGKGLPENETRHIFELNFQGSNRISGNGLGLTQAKAIVEHYGGTIYARSPEGSGMGIYIQLPTT